MQSHGQEDFRFLCPLFSAPRTRPAAGVVCPYMCMARGSVGAFLRDLTWHPFARVSIRVSSGVRIFSSRICTEQLTSGQFCCGRNVTELRLFPLWQDPAMFVFAACQFDTPTPPSPHPKKGHHPTGGLDYHLGPKCWCRRLVYLKISRNIAGSRDCVNVVCKGAARFYRHFTAQWSVISISWWFSGQMMSQWETIVTKIWHNKQQQ